MEVLFSSTKLHKECNTEKALRRAWGMENAARIQRRLVELEAAPSLADMFTLPQARCHALVGDHAGQFAVDVKHPYRLIFEPADDPLPRKPDGGLDLNRITKVRILEIKDYHGD